MKRFSLNAFTPAVLLILSACSSESFTDTRGRVASPTSTGIEDGGQNGPGTTPGTNTGTTNETTCPLPTPKPPIWAQASNPSEAIENIRITSDFPNRLNFEIDYYDLDQTRLAPYPKVIRTVQFGVIAAGDQGQTDQFVLVSSDPRFTGKIICDPQCKSGIIQLDVNSPNSALNGSVIISYQQKRITTLRRTIIEGTASSPLESEMIEFLSRGNQFPGTITQFEVERGWVKPYYAHLRFGNRNPDLLVISGSQFGVDAWVQITRTDRQGTTEGKVDGIITVTSLPSVEISFNTFNQLRSIGIFGAN